MGSGRHEIDVEYDGSLRKRSHSGKGFQVAPMHPPPPQMQYEAGERRRRVFLIPLFAVAYIIVLVVTMYFNNCPKDKDKNGKCLLHWLGRFSFQPFRENPLLGPSSKTLQNMGGLRANLVTHEHHEGWRLVTCMWLHAGVFHLVANMIGVLLIGIRLEKEFGFLKLAVIYLVSGFGGSLLSALFISNEVSVGASGALFGLLGATLSELLVNWTIYANKCLALFSLILIVAINLGLGLMPHVDNFAHIGGFIGGFLLGFVFLMKPQYGWVNLRNMPPGYGDQESAKSKHTCSQYVLSVVAAILLVAVYAGACLALFTGVDVNKKCSWCHYLSCVPTSAWKCDKYK